MESAESLLRQLNETDEHSRIDAKSTKNDVGDSILETISAFSNEPGMDGGYLLLGVAVSDRTLFPTYEPLDITDPDRIQSILATRCRENFNIAIRPQISVETVKGKRVIVAYVPEVSTNEKPVYIKKLGLQKGSFRRSGPTDQVCTDEDFSLLYQSRKSETFDQQVVDATADEANSDSIQHYRAILGKHEPDAECLTLRDDLFLLSIGAARRTGSGLALTLAGLLVFGERSAIRRCMPMVRLDYIRTRSKKWMGDSGEQTDSTSIFGRLPEVIQRAHSLILGDLPVRDSLADGAVERSESSSIPSRVVREAVVNALMHRDYRVPGPVQVIRYPNRIEIRNPGYSLKSDDAFYEPGSLPRNQALSSFLHCLRLAETRGMGLSIMQTTMNKHGLCAPYFDSNRASNQFSAFFMFHAFDQDDLAWIDGLGIGLELTENDKRALVFLREMEAINLGAYRAISGLDSTEASRMLRRLRDAEVIDIKGNSRKYYVLSPKVGSSKVKVGGLGSKVGGADAKVRGWNRDTGDDFSEIPEEVRTRLPDIGGKGTPRLVRRTILELCSWRPLMPMEIAQYMNRKSVKRLVESYISPMFEEGVLERTIPETPSHPAQRYSITGKGTQEIL